MKNDNSKILCETRYIKNQTISLRTEKLRFRGGEMLGNLSIAIEDGLTQRKIRRIVEKRVSQGFWANRKRCGTVDNYSRQKMRSNTKNQLKNLYGSSEFGFTSRLAMGC